MSSNDEYTTDQQLAVGGATLAAVGAFLPWIEVSLGNFGTAQKGLDVAAALDGRVVLVLAVLAVAVVVVREWDRTDAGAVAAFGALTAGIGVMYVLDPASAANASGEFGESLVRSGYGLYVTALGGLGMLVGGGLGFQD